jgi:hypothetical protein
MAAQAGKLKRGACHIRQSRGHLVVTADRDAVGEHERAKPRRRSDELSEILDDHLRE